MFSSVDDKQLFKNTLAIKNRMVKKLNAEQIRILENMKLTSGYQRRKE